VQLRLELTAAFEIGLATLAEEQRTLLSRHVLDGESIDVIAAALGVHRATAARQLAEARTALQRAAHAALRARLRLGKEELESFLRLADSQLEISVRRLLR
jgi:RNA polymerase sigma-70 factor (ECF subfamily)